MNRDVRRTGPYLVVALLMLVAFSPLYAQSSGNPPMDGFNMAGSDRMAIDLADKVMEKLGGRKNWDNTRYVTWRFFGRRLHVWDKWTGNIRVESGERTVLMNINNKSGRAWDDGQEITDPDTLADRMNWGYRAWVNDSYWVFMPYKLKDSGVTLKYNGETITDAGRPAHMLQLTFEGVGVTPQNKYDVCVDKESYMVTQFSYYRNASDEKPQWNRPWNNWQKFGAIMLSDDRGRGKHSDFAVYDELPAAVFESAAPVDMMALSKKD